MKLVMFLLAVTLLMPLTFMVLRIILSLFSSKSQRIKSSLLLFLNVDIYWSVCNFALLGPNEAFNSFIFFGGLVALLPINIAIFKTRFVSKVYVEDDKLCLVSIEHYLFKKSRRIPIPNIEGLDFPEARTWTDYPAKLEITLAGKKEELRIMDKKVWLSTKQTLLEINLPLQQVLSIT